MRRDWEAGILRPMHAMHIYQIHYGLEDERDSGFDVLDNASNERPDWFEYWPIRKYLLGETLDAVQ